MIVNTEVEVLKGNVAGAIKIWKRKTEWYGIKTILQDKKEYIKPSETKRIQKQKAIYKTKKRKLCQ